MVLFVQLGGRCYDWLVMKEWTELRIGKEFMRGFESKA